MSKFTRYQYLMVLILLCSRTGFAHPGHGAEGLLQGLLHPLSGFDHLFAALGVGLWAGRFSGAARRSLPAFFVLGSLCGGLGGLLGYLFPYFEVGIQFSLLFLGLALLFSPAIPMVFSTVLMLVFGFMHGSAHGSELGGDLAVLQFFIGFVVCTALLHGVGIVLARVLEKKPGVLLNSISS